MKQKKYQFTSAELGKLYTVRLHKSSTDCFNANCQKEKHKMEQAISKLAQSFNELLDLFKKEEKQRSQMVNLANTLSSNFALPFKFDTPSLIRLERFSDLAKTIKHYYLDNISIKPCSNANLLINTPKNSLLANNFPNQRINANQVQQLSRKRKQVTQPSSTKATVHSSPPRNFALVNQSSNLTAQRNITDQTHSYSEVANRSLVIKNTPTQPTILPRNNIHNGTEKPMATMAARHNPQTTPTLQQYPITSKQPIYSVMQPSISDHRPAIQLQNNKSIIANNNNNPIGKRLMVNYAADDGFCNLYYLENSNRAFFANSPIPFNYEIHPRPFPSTTTVSFNPNLQHQLPFLNRLSAKLIEFDKIERAEVQLIADYEYKHHHQKLVLYYYLKINSKSCESAQWEMHSKPFDCDEKGRLQMTMNFTKINEGDIIFISCRLSTSPSLGLSTDERNLGQFCAPLVVQLSSANVSKSFIANIQHFRTDSNSKRSLNSTTAKSSAETDVIVLD